MQLMVKNIKNSRLGHTPADLLLEDIIYLSASQAKRTGSTIAHYIPRSVPNVGEDCLLIENFPQGIKAYEEL